jgi:hypothetical protein
LRRQACLHRLLIGLAAACAVLAAPAAAAAGGAYAYLWADEPTADNYIPSSFYQANSAGALNTIRRESPGVYDVVFAGVARTLVGGTVEVTAYGSGGRTTCNILAWSGEHRGGDVFADVGCSDQNGVPTDSAFDAVYVAPLRRSGELGYVFADQPSEAAYAPLQNLQFNSKGFTNTITRSSAGNYLVQLPGLGGANGTVKVTASGNVTARCKVSAWGPFGTTEQVAVLCFDPAGFPVDSLFTMTYARNGSPLGRSHAYGYAWADQPTAASYTPATHYARTGPAGPITITRLGTGIYEVFLDDVGSDVLSDVQVSAYGGSPFQCRVDDWAPVGLGQRVDVECYRPDGTPADTFYTVQWMR